MELLTKETKTQDLEKYFKWENRIFELIHNSEISLNGILVNDLTEDYFKDVKEFELALMNLMPEKQKEYLYHTLRNCKSWIEIFTKSSKVGPVSDYEFDEESYLYNNFRAEIYSQYVSNNNPQLNVFKPQILALIDFFFQFGINDYLETTLEYRISKFVIEFDKTTLEEIKDFIFNQLNDIISNTVFHIRFIRYLENKLKEMGETSETIIDAAKKLTWLGTPAHFAYIIDILINKGYLEKPTKYAQTNARIFLSMFNFLNHKPSADSLGQLLHKDIDPISNPTHRTKLWSNIPHRNELDR